MKTPNAFRRPGQRRALRIELDTPLVPHAVAECVCEEVGVWLDQPLPRRWVWELTAYANTVYAHNARFRRKVRGQDTSGRDYLWVFMRHWLAGLLWERRPHLHARLPSDYCVAVRCRRSHPPRSADSKRRGGILRQPGRADVHGPRRITPLLPPHTSLSRELRHGHGHAS